ncbi:hypothetical protein SAMD00019534_048700 [Acytostelium subglobosum LB1]|uniref:hypothetical protein n=1 Tax=Acytostelium subglobosum LB1 TaxID=1410327 RepID=UPI000644D152|nr:hypothetical protein SAMD00019534_048700 [Acytostelium subglobosum LB1]GAM21695.1 hypothetical protein SAMD00019534_048700 [Acytostelium subglobosum LB1]|eukprot:XP_012755814.1 hypothetical protein SAMD00019534_048700 [Acytostelium subglobosum LB1]
MDQIPKEFIEIIHALGQNDTAIIKQAEERFNAYRAHPDQLVGCLIIILSSSDNQILKAYASVLVRPLLSESDPKCLWNSLSPDTKQHTKVQLLQCLQNESVKSTRHKIANIIGSLAPNLIQKNEWNDLIPYLFGAAKSENANLREASFIVIKLILSEISSDLIKPYIIQFRDLVNVGLVDTSIEVQVAALQTVSMFLNIRGIDLKPFQPLVSPMITTIGKAIASGHEKSAHDGILVFIIIADTKPAWFSTEPQKVMDPFFEILVSDMVEMEETRHFVMEFFLCVAEKRPSIYKKNELYFQKLVQVLYKWSASVEEIDFNQWNTQIDQSDDGDNSDDKVAQSAFDRLSKAVPTLTVKHVSMFLPQLLKSSFWGDRYAALMSISMICEGCKDNLIKNQGSLLDLILRLVTDPNPRVRWTLFFALSQMSKDFGTALHPFFKELFAAVGTTKGEKYQRNQGIVCMFLSSFIEDMDREMLRPFTEELFAYLEPLLASQNLYSAQHALSALSSIVQCIDEDFVKYYDKFMPFLINIIQNNKSKETRMLRGTAMETISIIGLAVKKEKFAPHLHQIMTYMAQQPPFESDDPQIDFFLRACTRFLQCLDTDFKPYLQFSMKPILEAIRAKVEITTTQYENITQDSISDASEMTVENKALALELIVFYANILGEELFPYIEELSKESLKLINYIYNEDIRVGAVQFLPFIIKISRAHFEKVLKVPDGTKVEFTINLFNFILEQLLKSLETESLPEIIGEKMRSIASCVEAMGTNFLSDIQLKATFKAFQNVLTSLDEVRQDIEDDKDEEDDENHLSEEMMVLEQAYDNTATAICQVIISSNQTSVNYFKEFLLSDILSRINSETDSEAIQSSMICVLDDLIDNGGEPVTQLYSHIIPSMITACASKDSAIIQGASFALGIAAQNGTVAFRPYLVESLKALVAIIQTPTAKSSEYKSSTENAISAIGRVIGHCSAQLGDHLQTLIPLWISNLPISDDEERTAVLRQLVVILKQHPQFFTQTELCRTLVVFSDASERNYISDELKPDIKQLILTLHQQAPAIFAHIDADKQQHLSKIVQ